MKLADLSMYRDPRNPREKLQLEIKESDAEKIISGVLHAFDNKAFVIENGVPDLTWPEELTGSDLDSKVVYDSLGADYDKFASIPFQTFKCDENEVRAQMIDLLHLESTSCVLEVGCGTGRGSESLAKLLFQGTLFLQEISRPLLVRAQEKLKRYQEKIQYSVGNASYLPFADDSFDALHHFGGLNTFSELKRFFQEAVRVVKPGGRIVVGDEGLGSWLKDTEFGRIMENSNPLLKSQVPFELLPVEARDVTVQWIMLGAYYVLSFTVAEGEPVADYHVAIPSARGGTHWTRYYGQLEGVTDEAKRLACKAQQASGMSMTEWLSSVVSDAALQQLKD